jgi:hypothetical protein
LIALINTFKIMTQRRHGDESFDLKWETAEKDSRPVVQALVASSLQLVTFTNDQQRNFMTWMHWWFGNSKICSSEMPAEFFSILVAMNDFLEAMLNSEVSNKVQASMWAAWPRALKLWQQGRYKISRCWCLVAVYQVVEVWQTGDQHVSSDLIGQQLTDALVDGTLNRTTFENITKWSTLKRSLKCQLVENNLMIAALLGTLLDCWSADDA